MAEEDGAAPALADDRGDALRSVQRIAGLVVGLATPAIVAAAVPLGVLALQPHVQAVITLQAGTSAPRWLAQLVGAVDPVTHEQLLIAGLIALPLASLLSLALAAIVVGLLTPVFAPARPSDRAPALLSE